MKLYSVQRYRKIEYFRRLEDAKKAARADVSESNLMTDVRLTHFNPSADNILSALNGDVRPTSAEVVYTAKYKIIRTTETA